MLGVPAASKITYVRPVGGPENTWNFGENPNINDLAWPPNSHERPRRLFCPKIIYGTFSGLIIIFVIIAKTIPPEDFLCNVAATGVFFGRKQAKEFAL